MPENTNSIPKVQLILPPPDMVYIPDLDINLLKPNPKNPMVMGERVASLLIDNIKKGGFITAITVWKKEGDEQYQIIDGEHRWRAMMALGYQTIPALFAKHIKTQTQADYFLLMLNRIKGHFEQDKLGQLIYDLDKNLVALSELTGYDKDLIDAMTRLVDVQKVDIDPEAVLRGMSNLSEEARKVADPLGVLDTAPIYEKKPTSLFMVSLQTEDFLKLSGFIEKIKEKENINDLAIMIVKVFKDYADRLQ